MKKPPLFYTLGQVRFNPVLNMADYITRIQSVFRRTYPDFVEDKQTRLQFNLAGGPTNQPTLQMLGASRWQFKNEKQTSGFILTGDSLTFNTTHYQDSEWFLTSIVDGLRIVNAEVGFAFIEGVGIRTLDAILPGLTETPHHYLHPGLLGIGSELQGEVVQSINELVMRGPYGQLTLRAVRLNGAIGTPVDLAPIPLALREDLRVYEGKHVILDIDCSQHERSAFNLNDVLFRLKAVKEGATDPFNKSVTSHAREVWG